MKKLIKGVHIIEKKVISDSRGKILHMLRNDDKNFKKFGEIYFSYVKPKKIKAWHIHTKMTLNYAAAYGKIKIVLFDDRKNSPTKGIVQEIFLSNSNHILVSIPPLVWNGFCSMNDDIAILANCSTVPYSDEEIIRKSPYDKFIPYNWS